MGIRQFLCAALCAAFSLHYAFGQNPQVRLSLEEAFSLADSASLRVLSARERLKSSEESYYEAKTSRLPDISAEASSGYISNGWVTDRDFSDGQKAPIPHFSLGASLSVSEPLFTGGRISSGIESAKTARDISYTDLQGEKQDTRFEVAGYLLDILRLQENERVLDSSIALSDSLISQVKEKFSQGTALKNDITRFTLRRHDLELQQERVRVQRKILERKLCDILGLDPSSEIIPDIDLGHETENPGKYSIDNADNSIAVKMAQLNVDMSRHSLKDSKASLLPTIALYASAQMTGPVTIEIPALNNNFSFFTAGISLSYNIASLFKGRRNVSSKKAALRSSMIDLDNAKIASRTAIESAILQLEESQTEVATGQESVALAQDSRDIIISRYLEGISLMTDMLDAENSLLQARLSLVDALVTRFYRVCALKYAYSSL